MVRRITVLACIVSIFFCTKALAQNEGLGTWNIANFRYSFNKKWSVWSELQTRSNQFYNHFYYHELKAGFQYNLTDAAALLMGTGQYTTYSPGGNFKSPVLTHESRLWQQVTLTNNISRLKLEHRYRIEQRWLTQGYRNRFRYRLSSIVPLNNATLQPHVFYLTAFDEIFLTNQKPHFERNRLYGGAGYQFSKTFTLQCGFITQYDYRAIGTSITNNFLQTLLLFNFKQKENKEYHPAAVD